MKKIQAGLTLLLTVFIVQTNVFVMEANAADKNIDKQQFVSQTEYEKTLEAFSQPSIQVFNDAENGNDSVITDEEHKILNEMKMAESKRIMQENIETKEDDEYALSQPVEGSQSQISQFNKRNWSYYLPQKWKAYGDAFVTNKNIVFGKQKKYVGHAALGGENRSRTLETALGTTLQWKSNFWFRPNNPKVNSWTPGTHLYYAVPGNGTWAQLRVRNASIAQYQKAHDYGDAQVGAKYNATFRSSGKGFYCSEIVAFAWRIGANIDIIPQKKTWDYILPMDLYRSPITYVHRGVIH